MNIDPWILTLSAITVLGTIAMGFYSAKKSKTASDFFVAGRSVSVGWNASAISGEYLSAASFMGVAGMVMSSGYDALWYPVCYACGYLFLLLFIAGPLRRFGAYTVPDFAEGRFDSPLFRKIAVVFVLFIGFFYTMPQMKGAGTTFAYIFKDADLRGWLPDFLLAHDKAGLAMIGLPYWVGVAVVGAVITLNVALGGMKGITLVQAFQYWAKMFAISVPIFVLMSVYGHYGKQLEVNGNIEPRTWTAETRMKSAETEANSRLSEELLFSEPEFGPKRPAWTNWQGLVPYAKWQLHEQGPKSEVNPTDIAVIRMERANLDTALYHYGRFVPQKVVKVNLYYPPVTFDFVTNLSVAQMLPQLRMLFQENGIDLVPFNNVLIASPTNRSEELTRYVGQLRQSVAMRKPLPEKAPADQKWISPFGPLTTKAAAKAGLKAEEQKPFSLLYTYSLIIALVCGTAGLPHILVRFYTNPDGVAAKRTTMWVMILIGVFYVFPPVFGVMGRNLMPELYLGAGSKGTDKIVLELPRILNELGSTGYQPVPSGDSPDGTGATSNAPSTSIDSNSPSSIPVGEVADRNGRVARSTQGIPWGSILSGITCAGAFAAFMSTFSGLLVSMTGALAHDVYGRILRPKSTPEQRMRMFKVGAVLIGGIAIFLGMQVEALEINFMVGQAFAIAAASYFPLLFMCVWWRGMTIQGAATGMLSGGLLALGGITLTSVSDIVLKSSVTNGTPNPLQGLESFWIAHPAIRILCEQPAIWAVPLAIGLMIVVSKLTKKDVPKDVRAKMLVLHAPEELGLKQEYIQEHQPLPH